MAINLKYECINKKLLNSVLEQNIIREKIELVEKLIEFSKNPAIITNINDISEETIKIFLKKYSSILEQMKIVLGEQFTLLNMPKEQCNNIFRVSLYNHDDLVISMFISTYSDIYSNIYPNIKAQTHFYIVKDIYYLLLDKPEIRASSMLLHSFACDVFDSDYWCTSAVGNMEAILKKFNVVIKNDFLPIMSSRLDQENRSKDGLAGRSRKGRSPPPYCYIRDNVRDCIKSDDSMKGFWKKELYDIKIIKIEQKDLIESIIAIPKVIHAAAAQDGGYYEKYMKYKTKYINLKNQKN